MGLVRVLTQEDKEALMLFEKKVHNVDTDSEMEWKIRCWGTSFREEALHFYFPLGWSFIQKKVNDMGEEIVGEGSIEGFFLAQPLLYFQGMTQILWVDYFSVTDQSAGENLILTAYGMAKEKHFQALFFNNYTSLINFVPSVLIEKSKNLGPDILKINTSKGRI